MSSRTPTLPPTDPAAWRALLNFLYLHEQDDLFRWAKAVRATVEEAEKKAAGEFREEPRGGGNDADGEEVA